MLNKICADLSTAARLDAIGVSPILQLGAAAAKLKREGRPVIVLGAGEPDFDTPQWVKDAAIRAMEAGQTKYTALDGSPELKAAIRRKFARENQLDYALDEITVGAGAKQVIHNAMMATLDAGDEVLLPAPYWTSYADIVALCEGVPTPVACREEDGFKLTPARLEAAITPRTRWLFLNSPSNPSGAAYAEAELAALAEVLARHPQVWVLCDDIYEHIVFDGFAFSTLAQVAPELKGRTLTVNGLSKAFAMTGWRVGYGAGPKALIAAIAVVQSQSTSCPSSISQAAAIAALDGPQDFLAERAASFQMRRDLVVAAVNAIPGLSCRAPEGAFYLYASCAGVIGKRTPKGETLGSDLEFCNYLLSDYDLAVVPGAAFGLSPYFRLSYATGVAELNDACSRLAAACNALS
jgi:aspartate aminotransferase